MDEKNLEALRLGPEWMLARFANLTNPVEFFDNYGDLHAGVGPRECLIYSKIFQSAWEAKTRAEKEHVSKHITAIFERERTDEFSGLLPPLEIKDPNDPRLRPAVVVVFESGQVTVKPRTLLDWLAKSLLDCRDRLAICERKDCEHPYFVKEHGRQRFCSHECANSVRELKKEQWWAENRDRFLKKWRQERKAGKRGKRR